MVQPPEDDDPLAIGALKGRRKSLFYSCAPSGRDSFPDTDSGGCTTG